MTVASLAPGLVTSIGSVPHRTTGAAVAFVLQRQPELPAAPSIPVAQPMEGMVAQAAWGVGGVTVTNDGSLAINPKAVDPEGTLADPDLCGAPFVTLRAFLTVIAGRTTPVKLQLTGPVTLALAIRAAGVADQLAFRIAGRAVRERAVGLIRLAQRLAPGVPLVVFLDEPALVATARASTVDPVLDANGTIDLVSSALAAIEPHAVTGLHCCGPADWRVVLQAGPQVLSLPVGAGIGASAGALSTFLERGGWVAWGVVPTDGPLGTHPSPLWRRLSDEWCDLTEAGCDPVALRRQALVTPVCGLAGHREVQAERVLQLTRAVAERLIDQVGGRRTSVQT